MREAIKFLSSIYNKQCQHGDYIVLSAKGDKWIDVPLRFNEDKIDQTLGDFFNRFPKEDYDLYFSPMPYKSGKRRIDNSIDTKYLTQDIDEYENTDELDPPPTYLWESSPGKYQGMWELDRYIEEKEYTPLNKALSKSLGVDDCFDFVHVYRIPGTINHKYKNKPKVGMVKKFNRIYKPKNLQKILKVSKTPNTSKTIEVNFNDNGERQIYAKYDIPQKVRTLLAMSDIASLDRSDTIWYIENTLNELGMNPNEIIYLVKGSAFNKYKGRADEDKRLRKELDKILTLQIDNAIEEEEQTSPLYTESYQDVMGSNDSFGGWLIKGFWGRRSHGIVAGQPKVFKSTLTQDLIVSVASGAPFLGKYEVLEPGPVLVIQNENTDWIMKDRTEKMISHRGLVGSVDIKNKTTLDIEFAPDLPIHFVNQQGFSFSNKKHRQFVEDEIVRIKPVLIVFDPLYLMFDGDLNKGNELNPLLQWLLHLKNYYKTGVMVIHHYNKGNATQTRGGQKMMGSGLLHGWVESAWYLKRVEEEEEHVPVDGDFDDQSEMPSKIILDREFRLAGSFPQVQLEVAMGKFGDPYYHVDVTTPDMSSDDKKSNSSKPHAVTEAIYNVLKYSTVPLTKEQIKTQLGLKNQQVNVSLDTLIKDAKVISTSGGYTTNT